MTFTVPSVVIDIYSYDPNVVAGIKCCLARIPSDIVNIIYTHDSMLHAVNTNTGAITGDASRSDIMILDVSDLQHEDLFDMKKRSFRENFKFNGVFVLYRKQGTEGMDIGLVCPTFDWVFAKVKLEIEKLNIIDTCKCNLK